MSLGVCRSVLLLIPAVLIMAGACGNESEGGPPGSPCSDEVMSHSPICGEPCTAACGCKGCTDGTTRTIDGAGYVCQANCYQPTGTIDDAGSGGSGGSAGSAADSGPDCETLACDPPSVCGACQNPCCCDPCVDLETTEIDGVLYVCTGGCFASA